MALQEFTSAGQAASASSVRQPGSFDQLTASKRTVGAEGADLRRDVVQPASSARAAQTISRILSVTMVEARPRLLGNEACPHYSRMPAWSRMNAYCSAYSR